MHIDRKIKRCRSLGSRAAGLLTAAIICVAGGCSSRLPPETAETAEAADEFGIRIETPVVLKDIPASSTVPVQVPVKNQNAHPVRLTFQAADCGCISAGEGLLLGAGETGLLSLTLAVGNSPRPISRSVLYTLSGTGESKTMKVDIKAVVSKPLIDPPMRDLGSCRPGQRYTVPFRIRSFPGWEVLGIRQVSGPNVAKVRQAVMYPSAGPDDFSIDVSIPSSSSDSVRWAFEIDWKLADSSDRRIIAEVQVVAKVENGVFQQNTLYLGIARKKEDLFAEREFSLSDKNVKLESLVQPTWDKKQGLVSIERSDSAIPSAKVRVVLSPDAAEGMQTYVVEVKATDNDQETDQSYIQIPIRVLVLP